MTPVNAFDSRKDAEEHVKKHKLGRTHEVVVFYKPSTGQIGDCKPSAGQIGYTVVRKA